MKNFKTTIIIIATILGVFLAACGSDSGTGSGIAQAETVYGLGECETANEGVVKLVTSEDQYYRCVNGAWEETEAPVQSSSSISSPFARSGNSNKSPLPESGVLKDSRDGQTYRTVKIGNQVWMAENLNYKTFDSFCYEDEELKCVKYGRLYTWLAARNSCPSGWHLPGKAEFEFLLNAVGGKDIAGKMLKSTSGWEDDGNGDDTFGFSALPAGYRDNEKKSYGVARYRARFWSSMENTNTTAYCMGLENADDNVELASTYKYYAFSVRCIKD